MTFVEFQLFIRALYLIHDCSETSGRRTAARNAKVGGAEKSRHLSEHGFAADLVPDTNTLDQRRRLCADARRLGLTALDETNHVHVHYPPA